MPLPVSPSRQHFEPDLALSYDTGAGNSPFGLGWRVNCPSITRKTSMGLPLYQDSDDSDVFVLSEAEDLVPLLVQQGDNWVPYSAPDPTGTFTVRRYRPRAEAGFARIERWQDNSSGDVHWQTISAQNVTRIFGQSPATRISDPADESRVFAWLLDFTFDDRGNAMSFQYKAEDATNAPVAAHEQGRVVSANRYLKRVLYGNTTPYSPSGSQPTSWFFELVLDFGEHDLTNPQPTETTVWPCRPDPFSNYRSCFEIRTYRLCRRALMFHRFPDGLGTPATLVRSLDLTYTTDAPKDATRPNYSLLASVTQQGYIPDSSGVPVATALPSLTFGYSPLTIEDTVEVAGPDVLGNLPAGVDGRGWRWCDLDGEGLPGIIAESDDAWYYKRNLSAYPFPGSSVTARFEPLELVATKPAGPAAAGSPQLVDLHGDGQLCAVDYGPPMAGYFARDGDGGWLPFKPFPTTAALPWADPNVRSVDLDGDGLADVLLTDDGAFTWFPWLAEDGFGPAQRVANTRDEDAGPALVLDEGDWSVYLADMNGDGLSDLARVRNGEVCYWPNLGYGRFGAKVVMDGAPWFDTPDDFDSRRIRFADVDGSGPADLIYIGPQGVTLWFSESGNSYTEPTTLASLPGADDVAVVSAVDLLGTGTGCLAWSSPLPAESGRQLRYVQLTAGVKPYLLNTAVNNMGAETTLTYAPSTRYYVEDLLAGTPWVTRLPFPVHVVAQKQVTDAISGTQLVSSYSYHHGYFDSVEREFRGFARVDQTDTDSVPAASGTGTFTQTPTKSGAEFVLPPVLTRTWVNTGAYVDGDEIAAALAGEYYQGDAGAKHLSGTLFLGEATPEEFREACRALRGRPLRSEIYALDGTAVAANPYTVTEHRYQVSLLQAPTAVSYGSVYACELESLSYNYERDPADPRAQHELTLEVDAYGTVTRSAGVAYPRRSPAYPEQSATLVTYVEHDVANVADQGDWYRVGLPVETRSYELTGVAPSAPGDLFDPAALLTQASAAEVLNYEQTATGAVAQKRLFGRERTVYRPNNLTGSLPTGQVESLALVDRTYRLMLTSGLISLAYSGISGTAPASSITAAATAAGGLVDLDGDGDLWAPSPRDFYSPAGTTFTMPTAPAPDPSYAAQHFYLPQGHVDPFGGVTAVTWTNDLVVGATTDPVGNVTTAAINYRVLQPWLVTDANQNRTGARFDALGMVTATALMGKALPNGTDEGDHLDLTTDEASPSDDPTSTYDYNLTAYSTWANNPSRDAAHPAPVWAHTRTRVVHKEPTTPWLESYTYIDGMARVALTKAQAEPGTAPVRDAAGNLVYGAGGQLELAPTTSRWAGTGRTVYDNKANPVKAYEPFFDSSPAYTDEIDLVQCGVTAITRYDPLSRAVRVDNPDGSFSSVEFDPWRRLAYDEDDNVLDSAWYQAFMAEPAGSDDRDAATKAAALANTPTVSDLDSLGRVFHTVGDGISGQLQTTFALDVQGRIVATTDALSRTVLTTMYDMAGGGAQTVSADAGQRWMLLDAGGKPILTWDSRSTRVRRTYDGAQRPAGVYVTLAAGAEQLAEQTIYGEGQANDVGANLRGAVFQQRDGTGVATTTAKDFKGNILAASRQLLDDFVDNVDWTTGPALSPETFTTASTYDALSRAVTATTPDGTVTSHTFNQRSLLSAVTVNLRGSATATSVVESITYDAKQQRQSIAYGNGATTDYTYDPETFRLTRLTTSRPGGAGALQDLTYAYDPVGNITRLDDAAQQTKFFNNQVVPANADYTYDAGYRLVRAAGREHVSQSAAAGTSWDDSSRISVPLPTDGQAMANYTEAYAYDSVGNFQTVTHTAASGSWTRSYSYDQPAAPAANNRLTSTTIGTTTERYTYDGNGNVTSMPQLSLVSWDWANRLAAAASQIVVEGTPETTYYRYDSSGQRTVKVTNNQAGTRTAERIYLGTYEVYREYSSSGSVSLEVDSVHVSDDAELAKRICLFETTLTAASPSTPAAASTTTSTTLTRYQLGNHLGSAVLELDDGAAIITYEEYYPYGSTSFQSGRSQSEVSLKRYRYTGKERDVESGLYYHGARYYAPWLGRWTACDPLGVVEGTNLYAYASGNPVIFSDPSGTLSDQDELPGPVLDVLSHFGTSSSPDGGSDGPGGGFFSAIGEFFSSIAKGIGSALSTAWEWVKGAASSAWEWTKGAVSAAWDWTKGAATSAWDWTKGAVSSAWEWTKGAASAAWDWTKGAVTSAWNWTKQAAAWTWNWVLAPLVRTATNALAGAVLGGLAGGPVGAVIGGILGAGTGAVHGWEMAAAHTYDWGSFSGWAEFVVDNTWSLPNSLIASVFATANVVGGNPINKGESQGTGQLVFQKELLPPYATTLGNVTVGSHPEVHERFHGFQARLFGPLFYPTVIANYAIATVAPYWLLYHSSRYPGLPIKSVGQYFSRGVYPHVWAEDWAYSIDPHSSPQ
ncbi:MAG TPA: SpvB/TcaC N-terminal domain-containing protein [Acidimicrobiales bacterium]|nr:SpvB/TcaC N-terminal domain-containing protein [Acidimicrobiales bacterium]